MWAGTLPPNQWGLHEMHGNVWEWCEDNWHGSYDGASADGFARIDPDRAAARVIRGGSWYDGAGLLRAACRYGTLGAVRTDFLGFRCAQVPWRR